MSARQLGRVFSEWTAGGQTLVLATVFETNGSTYSKAGARMLITGEGVFQGMLSGGCLEGDLAERAKIVAEGGVPQSVTYDLAQDDEDLWGLGVGCDGLMRIFLQPITADRNYQPLLAIQDSCEGSSSVIAAIVIASDIAELVAGNSLVTDGSALLWSDVATKFESEFMASAADVLDSSVSLVKSIENQGNHASVLFSIVRPIPRVLVLGAGLDAEPVVRMVSELGWRVTISDHRPGYINSGDFGLADKVQCVEAATLSESLDLNEFDAAVVMSHHLVTDEVYLRQLASTSMTYVGLLGPENRRKRILDSIGDEATGLKGRLFGPAGIDINASGPASIALSIVAQMHQLIVS